MRVSELIEQLEDLQQLGGEYIEVDTASVIEYVANMCRRPDITIDILDIEKQYVGHIDIDIEP